MFKVPERTVSKCTLSAILPPYVKIDLDKPTCRARWEKQEPISSFTELFNVSNFGVDWVN